MPSHVVDDVERVSWVAKAPVDGTQVVVCFQEEEKLTFHLVQDVYYVCAMLGGEGVGLGLLLLGDHFGTETGLGLVGILGIHDVIVSTTNDHGAEELVKIGTQLLGGLLYLAFVLGQEAPP